MVVSTPSASTFDQWYAALATTSSFDEAVAQHLDLPPALLATGLVNGSALSEVVQSLALSPGEALLDLACGRGGYGLAAAEATGAQLVGVDFSRVAIETARTGAEQSGWGDRARFLLGDLTATGLPTASVNAVMCLDSIQFATSTRAVAEECRLVLVPGGRLVVTCWEASGPEADQLPERIRQLDLHAALSEGGFEHVEVAERPGWLDRERRHWDAARDIDPGNDVGLQGLREEAEELLPMIPLMRRVLATATA